MKNNPKVSIGLPVYNGEDFITGAIDSILNQTFQDFELLIVDNASTDRTREICNSYLSKDNRIKYYRNENNIGAAGNFNVAFEHAVGIYFKWAACDDTIDKEFIAKCVAVLDKDAEVVLCHSNVKLIDHENNESDYKIKLANVNSSSVTKRFYDLTIIDHWCFHVFGLIRKSALERTKLIDSYIASDRTLLVHLALMGKFYDVPEYLFFARQHQKRSTKIPIHKRAQWFDTSKKRNIQMPRWQWLNECYKLVVRSSLNRREKIACLGYLAQWMRYYRSFLLEDIKTAFVQLSGIKNSTLKGALE